MKVFIIGAGFTGIALARTLVAEGNRVTLIDNDAERVRHAGDQLDCTVMEADGNDLAVLESAGVSSADALVTLTEDDELNMITCSLVDAVYPKILKIARVRNYAYYAAADAARRRQRASCPGGRPLYGIDVMLNPEVETAEAVTNAMEHGAVGSVVELEDGYVLATLRIGAESPLAGRPVRRLGEIPGWRYIVASAESGDRHVLPNGNLVLNAGDRIGIVARAADVPALALLTRSDETSARRVVIFGADRLGGLIAERHFSAERGGLLRRFFGVRRASGRELLIVDRDPARCREAARRFPDARILCGDVTDEALLAEERLTEADLLAAVSGNHELNLVTAAYLKSRGVRKTVALTASAAYGDIARKLGIDVSVPVRGTVVDSIMSHLRGRNVWSVHSLCDNRFVLVAGQIAEDARFAGLSLREAAASGGFLVLLYRKDGGGTLRLPDGDTVLEPGSNVVVIAHSGDRETLRRFFR